LTLTLLFTNDSTRDQAVVAFGLKKSGKFYHFFDGKPYDEIIGSNSHALGDLSQHSVVVGGRHNNKLYITGGIKNGKY